MRGTLIKILIVIAVIALLAGSFFLPNIVAGVADARTLDTLMMREAQGFSFDSRPKLAVPDRIALVADRSIEALPLNTGRIMDMAAASERAVEELTWFFSGGPIDFNFDLCLVEEGGAEFIINTYDPSVNLIVWEFTIVDPSKNTFIITLDDETGVIIKVIYRGAIMSDDRYAAALRLAEMMNDYYGLSISLADFQMGGDIAYYKANLTAGDMEIPMYGIIRASGFSMNEQA